MALEPALPRRLTPRPMASCRLNDRRPKLPQGSQKGLMRTEPSDRNNRRPQASTFRSSSSKIGCSKRSRAPCAVLKLSNRFCLRSCAACARWNGLGCMASPPPEVDKANQPQPKGIPCLAGPSPKSRPQAVASAAALCLGASMTRRSGRSGTALINWPRVR